MSDTCLMSKYYRNGTFADSLNKCLHFKSNIANNIQNLFCPMFYVLRNKLHMQKQHVTYLKYSSINQMIDNTRNASLILLVSKPATILDTSIWILAIHRMWRLILTSSCVYSVKKFAILIWVLT